MRLPLRHRMLGALAAMSFLLSAVPAPAVAAAVLEGHAPACSVSDGASVTETAGPETAPAATVTVTGTPHGQGGMPCGPGPCSMPFAACAGAGACLSMVPLPTHPSPALSSGPVGGVALGPEVGLSSFASGILTPPPRS